MWRELLRRYVDPTPPELGGIDDPAVRGELLRRAARESQHLVKSPLVLLLAIFGTNLALFWPEGVWLRLPLAAQLAVNGTLGGAIAEAWRWKRQRASLRRLLLAEGRCQRCGYLLREGVCSECGGHE